MTPVAFKHAQRRIVLRLLKLPKEQEGAVMVEFTIVAPLFMFLVVGTIQMMGIYHADSMLQYSNFMALRSGIVHYENVEKGFDQNRNNGINQSLIPTMEDAGKQAMGPFAKPLVGYETLSSRFPLDFAIDHAPAAVIDLRVTAGVLNVKTESGGARPSIYMDKWLTSQTELDLGLPIPWVGRVISAIHRGANTPTYQQMAQRGLDPFSNVSEPLGTLEHPIWKMNWITLKSDALLDRRESNFSDREVLWPLRGRTITTHSRFGGGSATINADVGTPHPAALPIQRRFPNQ